ncbi:MAG: hypothetical protein AB9836_10965 [Aminipila sp.]
MYLSTGYDTESIYYTEEIQLSAKDFMSLASDERLNNIEEK